MAKMRAGRISPEIDLRISVSKGQDGYVVAECLDVPGCISQGKTEAEAVANLYDVVRTSFALIVKDWIKKANSDGLHTSPANKSCHEKQIGPARRKSLDDLARAEHDEGLYDRTSDDPESEQ